MSATPAKTAEPKRKPRRLTHRLVIETRGLDDDAAARLHVALLTVAATSEHLHNYRSTALVREFHQAAADLALTYRSARSPKAIEDD